MPVMPEGPLRAACAHDQADGNARDHAIQMVIPMRSGRVGGLSLRLSLSVALIDRANYPGEADVSIISEGAR
jgi:hypothetical protein